MKEIAAASIGMGILNDTITRLSCVIICKSNPNKIDTIKNIKAK